MKIIITENQYELIKRDIEEESCDLFKDTTGRPDYDDILQNKPDQYLKNLSVEVISMTPEEYLKRCAEMQGTSYEEQLRTIVPSKKNKLIDLMGQGVKIDMPMIDYVNNFQEGRHRVMAAKELGCDNVKVAVFDKSGDEYSTEFKLSDYQFPDVETDEKGVYVKIDVNDQQKIESVFGDNSWAAIYDVFYPHDKKLNKGDHYWTPVRNYSLTKFDFDEDPIQLTEFLMNEINSRITQDEVDDYEYDVNNSDIYELLSITESLKGENESIKKLYQYMVELLGGVVTYMTKQHNSHFDQYIKGGYEVDYVTEGKNMYVKIYDTNTYDLNPHDYNLGYQVISENGGIITQSYFDFMSEEYFISRYSDELSTKTVDKFLSKFPFNP